jgi:uncharacterized DUF497 family protein
VKIDFDAAKSAKNARERGLPFELVARFEWEAATFEEDARFSYPEARFIAAGFIGARLYIVCFTPVLGGIRVISFRKANAREARGYEKKKAAH